MQVIITRPADDSTAWLRRLQAAPDWQGDRWQARQWPLIDICAWDAGGGDAAPAQAGGPPAGTAAAFDAVMFVSANAVRFFPPRLAGVAAPAGAGLQAWAVGPSTVSALRAAGWPAAAIVAPDGGAGELFDSEALWTRLAPAVRAGRFARVLIVRGTEADADGQPAGRDWLAERLRRAGVAVGQIAVYQRAQPRWSAVQQAAARAALGDGSVWLISSGQAAGHLERLLGAGAGAPADARQPPGRALFRAARAIATHPRIAQRLAAQGWGRVAVSRPEPQAVAASIKSLAYAR